METRLHPFEVGRVLGDTPSLAEGSRHRYRLRVGSAVFTHAEACTVEETPDGDAVLKFNVLDDGQVAEGKLDNSLVTLHYGQAGQPPELYFTGRLAWADENEATRTTEGEAYGPTRIMKGLSWDKPQRFKSVDLNNFFAAMQPLLYDKAARIEVVGGSLYVIDDAPIRPEVKLYESAEKFLDTAGFVIYSRPDMLVRVQPEPRPSTSGGFVATLSAADVPPGGLTIDEAREAPYAKVVAFAVNRDGSIKWRAEAGINNPGKFVPPNRIWWLPDFDGDAVTGQRVANDTAVAKQIMQYKGKGVGLPGNPYIHVFDAIRVFDERRASSTRPAGRAEYRAIVQHSILDAVAGTMEVEFDALRRSQTVEVARVRLPEPPPYLIPYPRLAAAQVGEDGSGLYFTMPAPANDPWYGEDAGGFWIDLDLAGDRAGEDAGGLWIDLSKV